MSDILIFNKDFRKLKNIMKIKLKTNGFTVIRRLDMRSSYSIVLNLAGLF